MTGDHDRIIRIEEKLDYLTQKMDNHLAHHFRYALLAWGTTLGLLATLLLKLWD